MFDKNHTDALIQAPQLNALFQYAMLLCQQRDNAYDLLQTAVEKYLKELQNQHRTIDNPLAFIRTIIRNLFIDQYRSQQRWKSESFEEESAHDISPLTPEDICISQNELDAVWSSLSPLDRDLMYYWAVLGYSTDEASKLMNMSRGTFLSRIHRLRKQLQQINDDHVQSGSKPS